jgi:acetylornithine deacetylase/succinyl-diaminopimelate desuccinylase-like protein
MIASRPTIDHEVLAELCLAMTAIPSPTGHERPLAEWLVGRLSDAGVAAELQTFADGDRANVVARLAGRGDGPSLLLYSAIDTAFPLPPDEAGDAPAPGDSPALTAGAQRTGNWIVGPGAENPKGFATAVIGAFLAVAASGTADLRGDVVLALTAGGMPSLGNPDRPGSGGLGAGARDFLARNPHPDVAIVAKPGDAVSVEEVGLALFRVRVSGDLGYTGIRHRAPMRNALVDAATLATRLEGWFPTYGAAHATATMTPQGAVTAIAGGWPRHPAFLPAGCDLSVDLRIVPGVTMEQARAVFTAAVMDLSGDLACDVAVTLLGGIPGASTSRESWIVLAAIAAWEARTGRHHVEATGTSGVTDASILRAAGIPTARIGMPRPADPSPDPRFTMGVVHVGAIATLSETIVEIALATIGRSREEVMAGSAGEGS